MSEEQKSQLSRRNFLKLAGLVGAAVQAGGMVAGGAAAGRDSESYTGWESFNPGTQFFDREPYRIEAPAHKPVGEVRRPSHLTDYVFGRVHNFQKAYQENPDWTLDDPVEELGVPQPLVEFYKKFPERLEWDYKTFSETIPTNMEDRKKYGNKYMLANAYSAGFTYHATNLPEPNTPPEEWDFTVTQRTGSETPPRVEPIRDPVPFKSPKLAKEFFKEVAHRFGATLVGFTKPNIDFFYQQGWAGCPDDYDFSQLPEHWKTAIVIGVPMEWDVVSASPQASTSYDAYDRVSTAALRLEGSLKNLGYAARSNTPMTSYDLLCPPHAIEAGLGEVGRFGYCLTPEVGGNARLAVVVTNLEVEYDQPIDFGVADFCNKCKICAEQCPSGAISFADSPEEQEWGQGSVLRGYEHWYINNGACYNYWRESMGPMGCRLCLIVCPYARKDNWLHDAARKLDPRDPTGTVNSSLLWMQKNFFDYPDAVEYRRPPEGHFETFRPEPPYLHAEKFLDLEFNYPKEK
jgi:reductive dehalogenase